jgi:hypothetical protein
MRHWVVVRPAGYGRRARQAVAGVRRPAAQQGARHVVFALTRLAHLPYHVSTIMALARLGARVTVVVCKPREISGKIPGATADVHREFLQWVDTLPLIEPNIRLHEQTKGNRIQRRLRRRSHRTYLRTLRSCANYLHRVDHHDPYVRRWVGHLPPKLRRALEHTPVRFLLGTSLVRRLLAAAESLLPADRQIHSWLERNQVHAVVASPTNLRWSPEAEFVKAANRAGIPSAVAVFSWDNLLTKGIVPCRPSMLLAWNQAHKRDAVEIHGIDAASVVITGAPFFDRWFQGQSPDDRQSFLERLGLVADARYVLYLGSSANIAPNESWLVRQVRDALDRDRRLASLELIVRAHPANPRMVADLLGAPGIRVTPSVLPWSDIAQREMLDLVHHSEAFIGVNTSAMLDAVIVGKPGFSIFSDEYRETHDDAPHFRDMKKANVLYLEADCDSAIRRIAAVLAGDDPRAVDRERFVQDFIRPRGFEQDAGAWQAEAILLLADGELPASIEKVLAEAGVRRGPTTEPLRASAGVA